MNYVFCSQALLEFNLFSPEFSSPGGSDFDDAVSLLEPVWERGFPRVGEDGAQGWGVELNRMNQMEEKVSSPVFWWMRKNRWVSLNYFTEAYAVYSKFKELDNFIKKI